MANLTKVYSIQIEASQAQQALTQAGKLFDDLKTKSAAANQEVKDTKEIYQQNTAELKNLVAQQKQLEAAKSKASAGAPALAASGALDKNLTEQKLLNSIVQESKIDYDNAREAATKAAQAVGAQSGAVKELQQSVKGYGAAAAAAALEFEPGTVGALRAEIERLKAGLDNAAVGSTKAATALASLASKQSQLRELNNQMNALNPRAQGRAFTVFSQAAVAGFTAAASAAEVFGLSSENAQKAQAKIQGLVAILYSVEQISKAASGENIALAKSILTSGKAYLAAGEAASTGAKITRAALISTGIGAIIALVGTLVSLWVEFGSAVSSSESTFTRFKATVTGGFDAMLAAGKDILILFGAFATYDFSAFKKTWQRIGKDTADAYAKGRAGVIADAHRAENQLLIDAYARQIELAKAKGEDTINLEIANSARKLANLKNESEEEKKAYLDAANELAILKAQRDKKDFDERRAINQEHLTAQAQLLAAQGKANFEAELAAKESELDQLRSATTRNEAAILAKEDELAAFHLAHAKELDDKARAALLARLDARASLQQAKGREAFAQQVAREEQELAFLKSAAQRDEAAIVAQQSKIADLKASHEQEQIEKRHAQRLAELDAVISLENVKGQESYNDQLKREEQQLAYLKQAGIRSEAAITAQLSKIANLKAAHELKEAADERAADLARLNARIALLAAQGEDTTQLQLDLKAKELTTLLAAESQNEAAIIAKQGEIDALITAQQIAVEDKRRALRVEEFENEMTLLEKQGKDTLALRLKFAQQQVALDTDTSEKGMARLRADVQKVKELQTELDGRGPDLFATILGKLFGVKSEDIPKLQKELSDAFSQLSQTTGQLASAFLESATQAADQQLTDAQARLQAATDQLSALQSSISSDDGQLAKSQGAARDYYLVKLQKEREETTKLAAVKAKAAADEKRATDEKHKLEKIGIELTAAAALGSNIAAAAAAVYAGVKAVSGAAALPFPLSLPAIIAAVAAVGAAVASARSLATATKYADGGVLEGPSHSQGGIPFTIAGRPGFEAEGGEMITNVKATKNNADWLHFINNQGKSKRLTLADFAEISRIQVAPPPSGGRYAAGGVLDISAPQRSAPTAGVGVGQVMVEKADLSELLATNRAALAHLQSISSATNTTASYGPAQLHIGPYEATKIDSEKQKADQAQGFATV